MSRINSVGLRTDKDEVIVFFRNNSPRIAEILTDIDFGSWFGDEVLDSQLIFKSLCRTIVGQQLSGRVADTIYRRLEELFEGNVTPERILVTDQDLIRGAGLSWAKVRSLRNLSEKVVGKELLLDSLVGMNNEDLVLELSKVKGIGRWTAEMFMMFRLGREDVFSWGDLGLKNGLKKYLDDNNASVSEMEAEVARWSPFRTYGAMAMWHLLDNR